MTYPTLPFALVYFLANATKERANLNAANQHVGVFVHKDKSVTSARLEIQRDDQMPAIEAEVAKLFARGACDTITLTFSTTGGEPVDYGVIIERGKEPMIFNWTWKPEFGITLVEDEDLLKQINDWAGVQLARDLMEGKQHA